MHCTCMSYIVCTQLCSFHYTTLTKNNTDTQRPSVTKTSSHTVYELCPPSRPHEASIQSIFLSQLYFHSEDLRTLRYRVQKALGKRGRSQKTFFQCETSKTAKCHSFLCIMHAFLLELSTRDVIKMAIIFGHFWPPLA